MYQITNQLNKLRELVASSNDKYQAYFQFYLLPMVESLIALAKHAKGLPDNFLDDEFSLCLVLYKRSDHDLSYRWAYDAYFLLFKWRITRGVDTLKDYQDLQDGFCQLKIMIGLFTHMVDCGRSIADDRLNSLLQLIISYIDNDGVFPDKATAFLIAVVKSGFEGNVFQNLLRRRLTHLQPMQVQSVLQALLSTNRHDDAMFLIDFVIFNCDATAGYICCKTIVNSPIHDRLLEGDEWFNAKVEKLLVDGVEETPGSHYLNSAFLFQDFDMPEDLALRAAENVGRDADEELGGFFINWVLTKLMVSGEERDKAKFEVGCQFAEKFSVLSTPDPVVLFLDKLSERRGAIADLSLLTPYITSPERIERFLSYLIDCVFSVPEWGYEQSERNLVLIVEFIKKSAEPDVAARRVMNEVVAKIMNVVDEVDRSEIVETVLEPFVINVIPKFINFISLEDMKPYCQQLLALCGDQQQGENSVINLKKIAGIVVTMLPRDELRFSTLQLFSLCRWSCAGEEYFGVGPEVSMPAWAILRSNEYLSWRRRELFEGYANFVNRYNCMCDNLPESLQAYDVPLWEFMLQMDAPIAKLEEIMCGNAFSFLASYYLAFTVIPAYRLLESVGGIDQAVVPSLRDIYLQFSDEICQGDNWKLWESMLTIGRSISLQYRINSEKSNDVLTQWGQVCARVLEKSTTLQECLSSIEREMFGVLCHHLGLPDVAEKSESDEQPETSESAEADKQFYAYRDKIRAGGIIDMVSAVANLQAQALESPYFAKLLEVLKEMLRKDIALPEDGGAESKASDDDSLLSTVIREHDVQVRGGIDCYGGNAGLAVDYPKVMNFIYHPGQAGDANVAIFNQYRVLWKSIMQLDAHLSEVLDGADEAESVTQDRFKKNLQSMRDLIRKTKAVLGGSTSIGEELTSSQVEQLKNNKKGLDKIVGKANYLQRTFLSELASHEHVGEFVGHVKAESEALDGLLLAAAEQQAEDAGEKKSVGEFSQMTAFRVEMLSKDDPDFLYVGAHVACCVAPGSEMFRAIIERRMDAAMTVPVVREAATGKIVALAWLYLANPAKGYCFYVAANFLEISTEYGKDDHAREAIVRALLHYTGQYASDIGSAGLLVGPLSYGQIPERDNLQQFPGIVFKKLGGYVDFGLDETTTDCTYYIASMDRDKRKKFRCFDVLNNIEFPSKVLDLIEELDAADSALSVWETIREKAIQYVRDQLAQFYEQEQSGQEAFDKILAKAELRGRKLVKEHVQKKQRGAQCDATSATALVQRRKVAENELCARAEVAQYQSVMTV